MIWRAHFGSIPTEASRSVSTELQSRWMREQGTLHVPDVLAQNDFPMLGSAGGLRTFLAVPLRQQGELIGVAVRTSHRGTPLHPGADQVTRDFRRPGGHRP